MYIKSLRKLKTYKCWGPTPEICSQLFSHMLYKSVVMRASKVILMNRQGRDLLHYTRGPQTWASIRITWRVWWDKGFCLHPETSCFSSFKVGAKNSLFSKFPVLLNQRVHPPDVQQSQTLNTKFCNGEIRAVYWQGAKPVEQETIA